MEKVIGERKHKVLNASAQDDPTYENYLRLAEWIFTGKVLTSDLQDQQEALKRMREIDELRAKGGKTEYEESTENKKKPKKNDNFKPKRIIIYVTDTKTNETIAYNSIREFCDINNISREAIKYQFKKTKSEEITFNDLIIKKVEKDTVKPKIQAHRIYLNRNVDLGKYKTTWNDYEKAFVVQNRPEMMWKDIAICLGRTAESCSNILRMLKKEGKVDFYRNLDISDKLKEVGFYK